MSTLTRSQGKRGVIPRLSFRSPALTAGLRNLFSNAVPASPRLPVLAAAALLLTALPLRAQQTVVTLDPSQTRVEFTLGDVLHTVHGTFKLKTGEIRFDRGNGKASGRIVVDATSGESGNGSRDKKMHAEYLESQKFPEIVFTPTQVRGAVSPSATSQVEVLGSFRLHGSDHDFTLNVTVQYGTDHLECTGRFTIPYVQWGIKNPSTFILRVSDKVDIEIHAAGKLAPGSS